MLLRPENDLEKHLASNQAAIESYFKQKWQSRASILTSSVDIRNAGFKITPVDTNVYPAGFNNLDPSLLTLASDILKEVILNKYPACKNVIIIPENHTRNIHYYENVAILLSLFERAGFEVEIGSTDAKHLTHVEPHENIKLNLYPLKKKENEICIQKFKPDLVVLNNDLSEGLPELLTNIKQPIEPPLSLGWFMRSKKKHFGFYSEIVNEFAQTLKIDPWQLYPLTYDCSDVDFMERSGLDCIAHYTHQLFEELNQKYQEYRIQEKPFVMIKADKGTYGMAVLPIFDAKEIYHLNRKKRLQMSSRKGRQQVNHVLIQEGVPSKELRGNPNATAEPVIYMIGNKMVGAFYRIHPGRKMNDNLNAPGMYFEKLNYTTCFETPLFYTYSVIARLALLAAQKEIE